MVFQLLSKENGKFVCKETRQGNCEKTGVTINVLCRKDGFSIGTDIRDYFKAGISSVTDADA